LCSPLSCTLPSFYNTASTTQSSVGTPDVAKSSSLLKSSVLGTRSKVFISLCFRHSEKAGLPSVTVSLFTETSDNQLSFLKQFEAIEGVTVSHAYCIK
jgi:hypothetical protein